MLLFYSFTFKPTQLSVCSLSLLISSVEVMSVCSLLVILLCFMSNGILLEVIGESCTEGFMDYSLLQVRAANPTGSLRNNRLSETNATRWIIIEDSMGNDIMFTCDTVVTEILIGVDIRTVNDSVGRNLYPKFEVWSLKMMNEYTRVMSIEIRLTPDNKMQQDENTATRWIIIEDQDENPMKRDIMFTCDTFITEILIGVDIRTVNDSV